MTTINGILKSYGLKSREKLTEQELKNQIKKIKRFGRRDWDAITEHEEIDELFWVLKNATFSIVVGDNRLFRKRFSDFGESKKMPGCFLETIEIEFFTDRPKKPLFFTRTESFTANQFLGRRLEEKVDQWEEWYEEYKLKSVFEPKESLIWLQKKLNFHTANWLMLLDEETALTELTKELFEHMSKIARTQ